MGDRLIFIFIGICMLMMIGLGVGMFYGRDYKKSTKTVVYEIKYCPFCGRKIEKKD